MTIPIQVPGEGPRDARIVICGEAPGATEVERGRPFVGAAGRLLDEMLAAANIRRADLYITNVVKVKPPNNEWNRLSELNVSPQEYYPILERELRSINPHLVVALGSHACEALAGKYGITKWRGSVLPCTLYSDGPKVLPSLHPAYIMRDFSMHPVAIADLQKAKREARTRELHIPTLDLIIQPTLHTIEEYVYRCIEKGIFAYDVETYGPRIRCLGLACENDSAICIPFKRGPSTNVWSEHDEEYIWGLLTKLFSTKNIMKVGQNAQFDLAFIAPHTGFPEPPLFDTMLAHHLVAPELPHDLDFLTSMYSNLGYYGLSTSVWKAPDFDCWTYNCKDCLATLHTYNGLQEEMDELGIRSFFEGYTMSLFCVLYDMQQRGVLIDTDKRTDVVTQLKTEIEQIKTQLDAETAPLELNPNSPAQLKDYFYTQRGYGAKVHRKRGTVTVDKTALLKLAGEGSKVATHILEYRKRQKLVSTFLETPTAPDGCLHTEYVISGTVTGRLSSRAPLTGYGTNLQNIPEPARTMFVPRSGMCFVKGDLSQAENRLVAWLTQGRMQQTFKRNEDVHSTTAALIFGGVWEQYPKGTKERQVSKVINHASNYGMGPGQLAALLTCGQREARELLEKYHAAYPEIRDWHSSIRSKLAKDRILRTPLGRVRQFLGRWGDELFRAAYSFIPQSTVADYLNMGLVELYLRLAGEFPEAAPLLQVHDEVVTECSTEHATAVEQMMHKCIERPLIVEGEIMSIPLESRILYENWLQ